MSLRTEKVTLVNVPLLPSWSVDWQITQEVRLYSNIAKHYRLPTFNDLYWANGGNPNLKPENGYSVDLGVEPHLKKGNYSVSANLNAFYRNVNNWIQWIPTGNFWMPENVMNVDSRGGEVFLKANYQSKSYSLSFQSFYSYTASENTLIGRQLIYVPFEKVGGNLSFTYSKYQLRYNHQFTGFTFISTDNSSWLPSFQTGDLFLGTQFIFKSLTIQPNLGVHNIWNHNYEVILYRPMPGRFYQLSFNFIFNNPNKIKL
jgi:iron complex outermembrane receptor protein